jgi:hypothetical protein
MEGTLMRRHQIFLYWGMPRMLLVICLSEWQRFKVRAAWLIATPQLVNSSSRYPFGLPLDALGDVQSAHGQTCRYG